MRNGVTFSAAYFTLIFSPIIRVGELAPQDVAMLNRQRLLASSPNPSPNSSPSDGNVSEISHATSNPTPNPTSCTPLDVNDEVFLALGRVFSGTITRASAEVGAGINSSGGNLSDEMTGLGLGAAEGDKLWVLGSRYDAMHAANIINISTSAAASESTDLVTGLELGLPPPLPNLRAVLSGSIGLYLCLGNS